MWSADRDGSVEYDDEMTNILNPLKKGRIDILQQIRIMMQQGAALLTLTHDITLRRLGTPIGTIARMLNTSAQNTGYGPSKKSFKLPHMR